MAAVGATIASLGPILAKAAPVLQTIATVGTAGATVAGGIMANRAKQSEALQLKAKANEELSASQQEAAAFARRKRLALSRIQAVNAAGGFSADDPTALGIMGETEAYGTLQEQLARYGGGSRAAGYRAAAGAARAEGSAAMIGSVARAGGTIASGVGSMASRYADPETDALKMKVGTGGMGLGMGRFY